MKLLVLLSGSVYLRYYGVGNGQHNLVNLFFTVFIWLTTAVYDFHRFSVSR